MNDLVRANKGQFKKGHKIQPLVPSRLKHGFSTTHVERNPIYSAWSRMKRRCNNENSKEYSAYGAKGIKVSDLWTSFENFYADTGSSWFLGASIDRIDNSKGYSAGNCRWATMADQARNKATVRLYMYAGKMLTIPQIAQRIDIKPKTLYSRLVRQKLPFERAITKPV